MKLAKRTEVEVRDSLHDAIDRMSIMEIVVLIFLVQMIRTREYVSHILPKPRKMLAGPKEKHELDWDFLGEAYTSIPSITEYAPFDWEHVVSAPLPPLPEPMFGIDSNGRYVRVGAGPNEREPGPSLKNPYWVDGGARIRPDYSLMPPEAIWAMCTPSRDQLTGRCHPAAESFGCSCSACRDSAGSVHIIPR